MQARITHSLVALVVSLGIYGANASPTPQCADGLALAGSPAVIDAPAAVLDTPEVVDTVQAPAMNSVASVESVSGPTAEQVTELQSVYAKIVDTVPNHGCTDDFTDVANVKMIADVATRENLVPADHFANYNCLVKRGHRHRTNSNRNNDANIVGPRFGFGGCGGGGCGGGCGVNEEECEGGEGGGEGGSEFFSHNHNQAINQNIDNNQNLNIDDFRSHFGFGGFGGFGDGGCGGGYKAKRSLAKRDDDGDDGGDCRRNTDNNNQDINQNIIANQNLLANLPVEEFFGGERRTRTGFSGAAFAATAPRPVVKSDDNFNVQNKISFADADGFFAKRSLEKRGRSGGAVIPSLEDDSNFNVINRVDFNNRETFNGQDDEDEDQGASHNRRNRRYGRHYRRDGGGEYFSDNHNQDINQNIESNQNLNVDLIHTMGQGIRDLFSGWGGFGGGDCGGCEGCYKKAKRSLEKRDWACGKVGAVRGCAGTGPGPCEGGSSMSGSSCSESTNTNSNININQNYNPLPETYYEEIVEYVPVYETKTVVEQIPTVETVTVYTTVPTVEYEYVEVEAVAPCPSRAPCSKCANECGCEKEDINTSSSSSTSNPVVNNYIDVGAAAVGPIEPVVPVTTSEVVETSESIDFAESCGSCGGIECLDSCTAASGAAVYKRSLPCDSSVSSTSSAEYLGRIGDCNKNVNNYVEPCAAPAPVAKTLDVVQPAVVAEPVVEVIEPVVEVVEPVVSETVIVEAIPPVVQKVVEPCPQPIIETVGHRTTTIQDHPTVEIIHEVAPAPVVEKVVEVVQPAPVVEKVVEVVQPAPVVEIVQPAPVVEEVIYEAPVRHEALSVNKNVKSTTTSTCAGLDVASPALGFADNTLNHAPAINGLCN